jgi:hypothetical protein
MNQERYKNEKKREGRMSRRRCRRIERRRTRRIDKGE